MFSIFLDLFISDISEFKIAFFFNRFEMKKVFVRFFEICVFVLVESFWICVRHVFWCFDNCVRFYLFFCSEICSSFLLISPLGLRFVFCCNLSMCWGFSMCFPAAMVLFCVFSSIVLKVFCEMCSIFVEMCFWDLFIVRDCLCGCSWDYPSYFVVSFDIYIYYTPMYIYARNSLILWYFRDSNNIGKPQSKNRF